MVFLFSFQLIKYSIVNICTYRKQKLENRNEEENNCQATKWRGSTQEELEMAKKRKSRLKLNLF